MHSFLGNIYSHQSWECYAQRQVLHCKWINLGFGSAEGRSSTAKLRNQGCSFTRDLTGAVASRCFPHPTLSLASEQTLKDLKDPRGTNEEVRRVGLANWALLISPKFIPGVKHQFHQGFWPDQTSGNSNQPSAPFFSSASLFAGLSEIYVLYFEMNKLRPRWRQL